MGSKTCSGIRYLLLIIILTVGLGITIGSDSGDDEKDDCSIYDWEEPTEYTYRLYLWIDDSLNYLSDGSQIVNAQSIDISGTIYKSYCSGKTSGNFS